MKSWKLAEKETAMLLGGKRRIRVSYSESVEDVLHDIFSIEVKYGKQVPKTVVVKEPTYYGDDYVLMPSKDYLWMLWRGKKPVSFKRCSATMFLHDGLTQAAKYCDKKTPVLSMKPTGHRGLILCFWTKDYNALIRSPSMLRRLNNLRAWKVN